MMSQVDQAEDGGRGSLVSVGGEKRGHQSVTPYSSSTATTLVSRIGSASLCEESVSCVSPSELDIPSSKSSRSKSFDAATVQQNQRQNQDEGRKPRASGGLLEIPKWKMFIRRASGPAAPSLTSSPASTTTTALPDVSFWKDCVHCLLQEEWLNKQLEHESSRSQA